MSGSLNHSGPHHPSSDKPGHDGAEPREARDTGRSGRGLPPPAFPPGPRRVQLRRHLGEEGGEGTEDDMGSAFISPDDPIPERSNFEGAFISPDDPIPDRRATEEDPEERWARAAGVSALDVNPDDVVVTGIGDDAHLDPREMAYTGDPHVREVVEAVKKLAAALERKGEVALRHSSDMSRLETQLRAYCVGFLAGRRAEDGEV